MRYSFVDLLSCPIDRLPLSLVAESTVHNPISEPYCPKPADGQLERNFNTEITSGVLYSVNFRWYPIIDGIPEILPDRLRDWDRDLLFLQDLDLAPDLRHRFEQSASNADLSVKTGDNYKQAEITLLEKVDDRQSFLGPGFLSPFNPHVFHHSAALIRGFSSCIPFMKITDGSVVLDSGSGYSWTTEWLMKMGIRAVGVEINRGYLEVGRQRMGVNQPELIIADAENLPFSSGVFDAVLGFDAFHHIPNRERAMEEFSRVLRHHGTVTLVEPGETHEFHPNSQAVMEKYGNLERGMSLEDVNEYVNGLPYDAPEEHFLVPLNRLSTGSAQSLVSRDFLGWSLFTINRK
jgi:uncharacterized protein YbaR (Trm112 family)/2-polyprenyl-3-methyl-5-hydroxy-6-metoxy-1,4-benzoquinol methylase